MNKKPRVSIVMCIEDSDGTFYQTLAGLFSQSFTNFELILIKSNSATQFFGITHQYSCRLLEVQNDVANSPSFDEKIMQEVHGEIVVLWNSKAVPLFSGTLENLIAPFDDADVMAAYAHRISLPEMNTRNGQDPDDRTRIGEFNSTFPFNPLPLLAIRKTVWKMHPLVKNICDTNHSDWDEWQILTGHKVHYIPSAPVMYSLNDFPKEQLVNRISNNYQESFQKTNLTSV